MIPIIQYWREHFLAVEASAALVLTGALAVWLVVLGGEAEVDKLLNGNRANIYRSLASIAGTLLGFSIAVASLVLSFISSKRLQILRGSRHYGSLWRTFFQTTRLLGASTIMALVCLLWDRDGAPCTWLVIPLCLFVTLTVVRLLRVIWILEQIILVVTKPSSTPLATAGGQKQTR